MVLSTPEIDARYSRENESLIAKHREWEIEIGDTEDASTFHPQLKLTPWDNETNLSIRFDPRGLFLPATPDVSFEREKVLWTAGDVQVRMYDKGGFERETGRFEFEVILGSKPLTNVLTWTITTKGLSFFKQPPNLAALQAGDPTATAQDWVFDSYAVYHATKKHDFTALGGKNYRAGKAFHIRRPKATDNLGRETWCDLDIDTAAGALKVIIPAAFLNAAAYPVSVDPDFGKQTQGASQVSIENRVRGAIATDSDAGGEVVSMGAWLDASGAGTKDVAVAIYATGENGALHANGVSDENAVETDSVFREIIFTFSTNPVLVASTDYALVAWAEGGAGDTRMARDIVADEQVDRFGFAYNYPSFPDPLGGTQGSNRFSIWGTYAGGSASQAVIIS